MTLHRDQQFGRAQKSVLARLYRAEPLAEVVNETCDPGLTAPDVYVLV